MMRQTVTGRLSSGGDARQADPGHDDLAICGRKHRLIRSPHGGWPLLAMAVCRQSHGGEVTRRQAATWWVMTEARPGQ